MKMPVARIMIALLVGIACTSRLDRMELGANAAESETIETIVFIRHAEKPSNGLGQLDCQGLNRALALPPVIRKAFGIPAAIFAANPSEPKPDDGKLYDYVRPLATIEPAAIAFGLPVHAEIGQSRIDDLRAQLDLPIYRDAYVLVAWEHTMAMLLARSLMKEYGGNADAVPDWKSTDFDSIYVLKIRRSGSSATASFELHHEGLDGQPTTCPGGAG
jgi:hypothetical protein